MGKVGGDGVSSNKQPLAYIADTLLDIEDRLPPRGVHNNKKRWWYAWQSRVTNAGKSGNFQVLQKAAVEIAWQIKNNVSTSWWNSQSVTWRTQVESSTTGSALSSHLNDLLTKAVDWSAARHLFSSESPDSDRKEKTLGDSGHLLVMDCSGVDDNGTPSRGTRLQVMMEKEKRNSQAGGKVDEASSVKKSPPDSALRRSKRKRIPGEDEEVSHVNSPGSENLTITENRVSIVKKKKGEEADEGRLSQPNVDKLDKAQSETDTPEGQSSVDETKVKQYRRKSHSIEASKQELGTEDAQENAIDRKTHIGYTRLRKSKRCLEPNRSEDGQTSETTGSVGKVDAVSAEPVLEVGNAMVLYEREEIVQLKDTTISVGSPRRSLRSSGLKNEFRKAELSKFSPEQESSPTQECRNIKDGPQQLDQDSDVKIPKKRGRPRKIKPTVLEKADDEDGKKSRNGNESPGISSAKGLYLSAQDSNLVSPEAIVTRVETGLRYAGDTDEPGKEDDEGGKQKSRNSTESPGISTAKDLHLSAQDSSVVTPEAIVNRVDTEIRYPGDTDEPGKEDDEGGKQKSRNSTESPEISTAKDLHLSAQDSSVVTPEAIVNRVDTEIRYPGDTDEPGKEDDEGGKQKSRNSTESPGISTAKDLHLSAQDSSVVTPEAIVNRVDTELRCPGDTDEPGKEDDEGGKQKSRNSTESPGISTAKDLHLSAQDSSVVTPEAIVNRVDTELRYAGHTDEPEKEDDGGGKQKSRNSTESPEISTTKDLRLPAQESYVVPAEVMVTRVETTLQKAENAGELEKEGERSSKQKVTNITEPPGITTAKKLSLSAPDSNFLTSKEMVIEVETSLQKAGPIKDEIGCSGATFSRTRRNIRRPKKYDSAESDCPRPHKAQIEGRQGRIRTRGEGKETNPSNDADDTRAGTENENDLAAKEKSSVGQKAFQVGEGRDGGGPDKSESSIAVTPKKRGRLIRKTSETKLNENQGEIDIRQARLTASILRSERMRVRSGGARLDVPDESGTDKSSGEEERNDGVKNCNLGERNSRKRQRSPSSDSDYEVTTSISEDHSEEKFKVGDDTEDTENMDLEDSWGERLPIEDLDTEAYFPMGSEIKQPQPGQLPPSLEPSVAVQDWTVGDAECAVCSFAGADELMLLCDQRGCTCALHTFCLTPPLAAIPEGEWLCPHCTRLKDSHSDTRRMPKTCSKYPAKSLGSIIGSRMDPLQGEGNIQYLVKWDSLSHEHDTWIPEDWILYMNPRQLLSFKKKYSLPETVFNIDERRPEWLIVDRIIACRKQASKTPVKPSQVSDLLQSRQQHNTGVEFLVKWQALEHKSATWEKERDTEEFRQAISSYVGRHETAEGSGSRKKEMKPVADIKMQPDYLSGGTMYGFQIHGLKWLLSNFEQGRNVILADEMGLGKTIQTLAFISCVRYEGLSSRPALVIAPKSTLSAWEQEFRSWIPSLNVVLYQGDKENRALIRQHEFYTASKKPLMEVLLTSYDFAFLDANFLSKYHWSALIVDEGHRVKNVRSQLGAKLQVPTAEFRLLLTGTPVQNNLEELFTLLHFLDPKEFPDPVESAKQFIEVDAHGNKAQSDGKVIEQQVARLKELLSPRMLRRLKMEVLCDMLPGKKHVQVPCALTPLQRHLYSAVLRKNFEVLNKGVKSGLKRNLQMIVTDLRMVCDHPYLFPGKEPQHLEPAEVYKMMVTASGKFQFLEKLLPLLKEQGHRVLLFSQMTKMLDILEDFMGFLGLSYSRLDGDSSASSREESIAEFNAENSSTFIFLISTRAGGLGINLPTADTVIMYDPDFNPFVDIQAQARAHRIGQDKKVLVYQLITKCSVEEKILQRARKKLAMENLVMSKESKESAADINTLLLHGAQKVLDEHSIEDTSITWTDESVKKLLDRDVLISTGNDDEPTAHGYLGTVQGDGFVSPVVNDEEDQEPKGGNGSEWRELLHHFVEPEEKEELGRGKRVRKQVKYDVEGGHEGHEEDEYNPSSTDRESSSDSDSSMDSEDMNRRRHRRTGDQVVRGVPVEEYPGISGISNSSHTFGTPNHFFPGGATTVPSSLPSNSRLHPSMLSGISQRVMGCSENMGYPLTSQVAPSFGTMGSSNDPGSISKVVLPSKSRVAGVSRAGAAPPQLRPIPMNPAMLGDPSRFGHMSAEAMALQARTLMSGTGLNNTQFVNPHVPFPGVYPYANNSNPYAAPSYPGIPLPGPPYMPYSAQPLPSQQLPPHFLFNDGRVNPQSLNTQNPAWASFSDLQQAAQGWSMPNMEQRSTPAVSRRAWSDMGGGYMSSGQHDSSGGICQSPIMSSATFQSAPSSVQGRIPTAVYHQSSGKNKRVSYSSNLPSAAAAPWLAGYCTVTAPLSRQVEHQVISPSVPTPVPISPVPVMSGVPHIPQLYPALEFHDPTALQVPPMPMNVLPSARVPEPLAMQASVVVNSIPSPPALKLARPHLNLRPISSLDRNSSSCLLSQNQAGGVTLPHVGAVAVPTLPMPQSLQSPTFARALPASEPRVDVVEMFIGRGSTGHCQPPLAALGEQIVNDGGNCNDLSLHQLESIDLASTPKQLPVQSKKPLWVPKGDAGLLMGPLLPIKVEEGS